MENSKAVIQKSSRSHLLEVPTIVISQGNFGVLDSWSLTRGERTWMCNSFTTTWIVLGSCPLMCSRGRKYPPLGTRLVQR